MPASFQRHKNRQGRPHLETPAAASPLPMLRQLRGDAPAPFSEILSHQSPGRSQITRRKVASADDPRRLNLRPSALHSSPTLIELQTRRKRKVSLSCYMRRVHRVRHIQQIGREAKPFQCPTHRIHLVADRDIQSHGIACDSVAAVVASGGPCRSGHCSRTSAIPRLASSTVRSNHTSNCRCLFALTGSSPGASRRDS